MSFMEARKELVREAKDIGRHPPNVYMLERERAASSLAESVAATEQKLEALRRPCKTFPALTTWLEEHQNIADRKKVWVLGGPSRMHNTQFAMSCHPWGSVLEVNCAGCMDPRLDAIDVAVHSLILFDEASVALVLKQRRLFQAPNDPAHSWTSPTNQAAYDVFLHHSMVVLCSSSWTQQLLSTPASEAAWRTGKPVLVSVREPMFAASSSKCAMRASEFSTTPTVDDSSDL